jgi:hypothetical protein
MNYTTFKAEMNNRGHEVYKRGSIITIKPNNNYIEYGKGFKNTHEILEDTELADLLRDGEAKIKEFDHFNTWVYSLKVKLL